jgi:hypothetical protein
LIDVLQVGQVEARLLQEQALVSQSAILLRREPERLLEGARERFLRFVSSHDRDV